MGSSSPNRSDNKTYLKPPPRQQWLPVIPPKHLSPPTHPTPADWYLSIQWSPSELPKDPAIPGWIPGTDWQSSNKALRFFPRFPIYFGGSNFSKKIHLVSTVWSSRSGNPTSNWSCSGKCKNASLFETPAATKWFFFKNATFKTGIRIHLTTATWISYTYSWGYRYFFRNIQC